MTGLVIFRDEQGNVGEYRFAQNGDESGDAWVNVCERAMKRLGLTESAEANARWPLVKSHAAERAEQWKEKR